MLQAHGLSQLGRPQLRKDRLAEEHLPGPAGRYCSWMKRWHWVRPKTAWRVDHGHMFAVHDDQLEMQGSYWPVPAAKALAQCVTCRAAAM